MSIQRALPCAEDVVPFAPLMTRRTNPRYSHWLLSRARETCSGRLVGAAAGGGTMVMSTAAFRFSGLLVVDSGATMELGRPGDDDVGFDGGGADRARRGTGSSTTDRKICSTDRGPRVFTISLTHSRARGADDGGRRRRDASYGVARDSHPVSTIRSGGPRLHISHPLARARR